MGVFSFLGKKLGHYADDVAKKTAAAAETAGKRTVKETEKVVKKNADGTTSTVVKETVDEAAKPQGSGMFNFLDKHGKGIAYGTGTIGLVTYSANSEGGALGLIKRVAVGKNRSVLEATGQELVGQKNLDAVSDTVKATVQQIKEVGGNVVDAAGDAYHSVSNGVGDMMARNQQMPVYQDPYAGANPYQAPMQQSFWNNVAGTGMNGWDIGKLGAAAWMMFGSRMPFIFRLLGGFLGANALNDFGTRGQQAQAYQGGYPQAVQPSYAQQQQIQQQPSYPPQTPANEPEPDSEYNIHRSR